MRLPTRKVWRAFPELDPFTDDECRAYMRESRGRRAFGNLVVLPASVVLGVALGMTGWAGLAFTLESLGIELESPRVPEWVHALVLLLLVLIVFGAPLIVALVARDAWVRRALRRRINLASCGGCGYSLLGLTVRADAETGDEFVMCPECARRTSLRGIGATRADFEIRSAPATP